MTGAARAVLGAAIGALITLLAHPISRSFLLSDFVAPTRTVTPKREADLGDLSNLLITLGAKFAARAPISEEELERGLRATRTGASLEPDNAYWIQVSSALRNLSGNKEAATGDWLLASKKRIWNDHQSTVLSNDRVILAREFGAAQAWQLAYVYYLRSESAANLILATGRMLLAGTTASTKEGLQLRAATVRNGDLLRENARSIRVGNFGAQLTEIASHPPGTLGVVSNRKLLVARLDLFNNLRLTGQEDQALRVDKAYRELDAWAALMNADEAAEKVGELSAYSLVYTCLPGGFLICGLIGMLFWTGGMLIRNAQHVNMWPAMIAGAALAAVAYAITYLPLAAGATLGCVAFLAFTPRHERKSVSQDLGPLFNFVLGTLALMFGTVMCAFILGISAPASAILPFLGVPDEYMSGSAVLLALAILLLSMTLLVAPMYALALRLNTGFVLSLTLRRFGGILAAFSLGLVVLGTPAAIYADRQISDTLQQIVLNEPLYYLTQSR